MNLTEAIAVFDKSASRTKPNAQTEAWSVIRVELMLLVAAPVVDVYEMHDGRIVTDAPGLLNGQRVRLVTDAEAK